MEGDIMGYYNDDLVDNEDELQDAINDKSHLWSLDTTTGTVPIPYKIDNWIDPDKRDEITKAITEYDRKTCIR